MIKYLKISLLIPAFLLMALRMTAQDQRYYLYIQSERSQPFYVRFDGKVLSSSDKGYLIISKLPAGTANMRIGFARGDIPEHQYRVKIGGPNDQGYLLKQDGLYNIISYATIRPVKNGEVAEAEPASKLTGTPPEPAAAAVVAVQETPAPAAATPAEEPQKAMMDSMQKDLAAAFPNKDAGVTVAPGTRPVRQTNKFSDALDKVVKDDRPEEPLVDPNAGTGMILAPKADSAAAPQPEERKGRKRRNKDRDPLTAEEQQILADVMAEEQKAAEPAPAPATEAPAVVAAPAEETPAPVEETPVPEKKAKKKKKASTDEPAFIDFQDGSKAATAAATPAVVEEPVAVAAEEPVKTSKKKKRKSEEAAGTQNNVLTDSTGYAVSDLNIDHPRESKKDRKKKKQEAAEGGDVAVPVAAAEVPAPVVDNKSSLKMINSDCGKVMDDDTFRKTLRKYVAGKDDDGMIDAFKKQTKGYCLETSQIKSLVQLLGSDDSRYRLLDAAYPKAYDSEKFASLESTLSDSYFRGRFRAMLHR